MARNPVQFQKGISLNDIEQQCLLSLAQCP